MTKRIDEFVNYHISGDGECNNVVLKSWADIKKLSLQQRYELAYFFSITYCVESAIILFEEQRNIFRDIKSWVLINKPSILFQSDRKYIRMKDSFERCLKSFSKINNVQAFLQKVQENGIIKLDKAIPYVSSWELFGRFSAFLFLETFVELTNLPIENTTIEWKKGNTATSGLLNVFGFDKEANLFDKTNKLAFDTKDMDKMLSALIDFIKSSNGNTNVTEIETSLCAYRKFFKGSRYNGYYLDRMLEEIYSMNEKYPKVSKELLNIRANKFNPKYLGEISGWSGIRKEMKKSYLRTGVVL